ncbi:hypothetical protein HZH66_007960 [Vespula vulgaris]|uniref:Uncharacterized protein n=1 Tax=Vespula vulgaris TaxID=7454 RepID=A0A834K065_VESVU|nr:hypothetical protein HZH66_007960 [Vespula vulgaris]
MNSKAAWRGHWPPLKDGMLYVALFPSQGTKKFESPSTTRESHHSRNVIRKETLKATNIMFMGLDYEENNVS